MNDDSSQNEYQQITQKNLSYVETQLQNSKKQIEDSLTQDELDVIQPIFKTMDEKIQEAKMISKDLLLSLIEPEKNSFELYQKMQEKIEEIKKQEDQARQAFNVKTDELSEVRQAKETTKGNVEDIQKKSQEMEATSKDIAAMIKMLEDKIALQKELSETERQAKKSHKLMTILLTYLLFQNLKSKQKGLLPTLLVSYLAAEVLGNLLMPQEGVLNSYHDFSKEIEDLLKDTQDLQKELEKNIDKIEDLEKEFVAKYQPYLELQEFQDLLHMMKKIEDALQEKTKTVKNTEEKLQDIDKDNKTMVKRMEV